MLYYFHDNNELLLSTAQEVGRVLLERRSAVLLNARFGNLGETCQK